MKSEGKTRETAFYTRLPMFRADAEVSRKELASAVGVHFQTIGYIERGEYTPSIVLSLKIAGYFSVPVETMFSLKPFPRLTARALNLSDVS